MTIDSRFLGHSRVFDKAIIVFLLVHFALMAANAGNYPTELDTPYHLLMGKMFSDQGHVALWDSYEFAPVGRPQLYPPLLHILVWFLRSLTQLPYLDIGRIMVLLQNIAGLAALALVLRRLLGSFISLLAIVFFTSSTESWWWQTSVAPIALTTALFFPFVYFFHQKRIFVCVLFLTACFYLHYGYSLILVAAVLLASLFTSGYRRVYFKKALLILGVSLCLFSPWLGRLWFYRSYLLDRAAADSFCALSFISSKIYFKEVLFNISVVVWPLALVGFGFCWKRKKEAFIYPLLISIFLVHFVYLFLFGGIRFNAHMPLAISPLAALGVGVVWTRIDRVRVPASRRLLQWLMGLVVAFSIFFEFFCPWPSLVKANEKHIAFMGLRPDEVYIRPTPLTHEIMALKTSAPLRGKHRVRVQDFFTLKSTGLMMDYIRDAVAEDEIIHVDNGALGDYITLETGRRTDWGMYWEAVTPELKEALDKNTGSGVYVSLKRDFSNVIPARYVQGKISPRFLARFGRWSVGRLSPDEAREKIDRAMAL